MKRRPGFLLKEVSKTPVIVPVGKAVFDFNGIVTLNSSGAFLWEALEQDVSEENLIQALLEKYEVEEDTAREDVRQFLSVLNSKGMIE